MMRIWTVFVNFFFKFANFAKKQGHFLWHQKNLKKFILRKIKCIFKIVNMF